MYFKHHTYRPTCGSNHMIETTIYVEKLESGILIVKNVPCRKCSQCGEVPSPDGKRSTVKEENIHV